MPKTAILTDSACDLTPELQEKYDIHVVPICISVEDKNYQEGVDLTPQEYYELLRTASSIPATAHITPFRFQEAYEKFREEGYTDLIVVTINAGASATYDAAHLAVRLFEEEHGEQTLNIHVVDSRTYSRAYGYALCRASEMLQAGASVQEVLDYFDDWFRCMEIVLAPYTLRYIKQSGRISAAVAFAGELLGLRPVITLIDGESAVQSKVRGDRQVVPALCAYFSEHREDKERSPYLVGTTNLENGQALAALCEETIGYPPEEIFYLGCSVTTNTGPDAIAIVYRGAKRA